MKIKSIVHKSILGLTVSLTALAMVACTAESIESTPVADIAAAAPSIETESIDTVDQPVIEIQDLTIVDQSGVTSIDAAALDIALSTTISTELTELEAAGLIFMREEEKLARDVYLTLYDQWQINIFQNIASSEQTHTDAIKTLLDQYGLDDPVVNDEIGVFANPDLQALYDQLIASGSQSLDDALKVGAAIEEIDILDLEKYIAQTDNADIQMVYDNLLKGSRNHLRAFVSNMQNQTGTTYQPQYLSQEAYQAIIGSDIESGGSRNGQESGQGSGRGNSGKGHG